MQFVRMASLGLALALFSHGVSNAAQNQGEYILMAPRSGTGVVDLLRVAPNGRISPGSNFDIRDHSPEFIDVSEVTVSRTGRYAYFSENSGRRGVLYSVGPECVFTFLAGWNDERGGGGFSPDESLFTNACGIRGRVYGGPKVEVYDLRASSPTLLISQAVTTTQGLSLAKHLVTSRGEIMSYGLNGVLHAPKAFALYQYDSVHNSIALGQYIEGLDFPHAALKSTEDVVAFAGNAIGTMAPLAQGGYEVRYEWPGLPGWEDYADSWGGVGVYFTPNDQYIVVAILAPYEDYRGEPGGFAVFTLNANRELVFQSHLPRFWLIDMAMSPDGRYVAGFYNTFSSEKKLGIFRLSDGALEEVDTVTVNHFISTLEFLPQAIPAAAKDWTLYSDETPKAAGASRATD